MTTGTYKPGDVVSAYIPFADAGGGKVRPALVVSSEAYNRRTDKVILTSITKSPNPEGQYVAVRLAEGTLKYESKAKTDFLMTIEQKLIQRRLGKVTDAVRDQVAAYVIPNLHIPRK